MSLDEKLDSERRKEAKVVATKILEEKLEEQAIERTAEKLAKGCANVLSYFGLAIDLSAGFYVGYNDGAGNNLEPALKAVMLTTPAAMSGIKSTLLGYGSKFVWREGIKGATHKQKL